jgi:hypothetical protein
MFRTIARTAPDAAAAALSLEAGAPAWLAGARRRPSRRRTTGGVVPRRRRPLAVDAPSSWISERLEYRFAIKAEQATMASLSKPRSISEVRSTGTTSITRALPPRIPNEVAVNAAARTRTVLAAPLTYAGMPSDRLWQFENGSVNLGMLNVQAHDPARLCLVEFATIFGNDWCLVPFDVDTAA